MKALIERKWNGAVTVDEESNFTLTIEISLSDRCPGLGGSVHGGLNQPQSLLGETFTLSAKRVGRHAFNFLERSNKMARSAIAHGIGHLAERFI
ncbi:MAG: hypothetical protein U1A06_15495 [Hoeflea sp.]|nr:hypothetical protein [Hoeflea sp.]